MLDDGTIKLKTESIETFIASKCTQTSQINLELELSSDILDSTAKQTVTVPISQARSYEFDALKSSAPQPKPLKIDQLTLSQTGELRISYTK